MAVKAVENYWSALKYVENPCFEAKLRALEKSEQAITYVGDFTEEELRKYLFVNIKIVKYVYDSLEMDLLMDVLKEKMGQEEVSESYLKDFMELQILDINKVNFVRDYGSKNAKKALMNYVLSR